MMCEDIDATSVIDELLDGKWVESDRVQKALGLSFNECFRRFDFCRTAEWWSIVGKTEEERSRSGQKITCFFRVNIKEAIPNDKHQSNGK